MCGGMYTVSHPQNSRSDGWWSRHGDERERAAMVGPVSSGKEVRLKKPVGEMSRPREEHLDNCTASCWLNGFICNLFRGVTLDGDQFCILDICGAPPETGQAKPSGVHERLPSAWWPRRSGRLRSKRE